MWVHPAQQTMTLMPASDCLGVHESRERTDMVQHPVLLTEPPLNPRTNRDTAAQILFETFNVPALYTSIQAVLSLYASGRTTGIVLDAGDGVSHAVPVYEGFAIPNSIRRIDVAGRDVTEHLQTLLRKSGYIFHTSAEKEVVRMIKEKTGFVALDPRKEEKEWQATGGRQEGKSVEYVLPDGQKLKVSTRGVARLCEGVDTSMTDRTREVQSSGDTFRPRDHRSGVPGHTSNSSRCHWPDGPGPSKIALRQHRTLWWVDPHQRVRRSTPARGSATGSQRDEDQDLCSSGEKVQHVDRWKHPRGTEHVQKGKFALRA